MSSSRRISRADLFVVAAPSAAGKTTLIERLYSASDASVPEFSVSHTTRSPRAGEIDGVSYHFVGDAEFDRMVEADLFLEWADVHAHRYGTARSEVEGRFARGADVLLDIDVQGVASVKAAYPDACAILVLPPSYAELQRRISARGQDGAESIARRLSVSLWEIERYALFDYAIINSDVELATRELAAVITARGVRLERREARVKAILEDFRRALDPTP
jgi:guanylate kinase